ncbi:hypothetical protein [uncultured Microbacterium sp.]|uniref:hypothetical protein n=1 Tax=uncultured Microbacterium sp. TaxID=191216 RepID=UPI0025DCC652|nr:hypothetical protein [uncultured Microbacterium sp.]
MHVHALDPAAGVLELPAELSGTVVARWADGAPAQTESRPDGATVAWIPERLRDAPVAVLTVEVR